MDPLILATRGSPLALWQANAVAARLKSVHPGLTVELHIVRTLGDRDQATQILGLSATGVFTKEVDACVLEGRAHAAVHSLKDQVTTLADGLILQMVLPRGAVQDVFVGKNGARLAQLLPGAQVGTGSFRRIAQLRRCRPDFSVSAVRGNVETRLGLARSGSLDGVLLAAAGLERLGLMDLDVERLDLTDFLPAPSQGIVGVTCREGDSRTADLLSRADDASTHSVARAERAFLRALHGGCNVPAGALCERDSLGRLTLRGRVLSLDGRQCLESRQADWTGDPEVLGAAVAEDLLRQGAGPLIAAERT